MVNPRQYDDIVQIEEELLNRIKDDWQNFGPYEVKDFRLARTLTPDAQLPILALGITDVEVRYFVGGSYPVFRGMVAVIVPFRGTQRNIKALWELGQRVAGILTKNANTDHWTDLSILNIRVHRGEEEPPRWEAVTITFTLKATPRNLTSTP